MHRIARNLKLFLFIIFLIQSQAFSQLGKNLGMLDEYDVIPYLKPIITALSNASLSGTGFKTEIDKELVISVAIKGFAMYPTGSEKMFNPSGNGGISGGGTTSILGKTGSVFSGPSNQKYTYPDGYDVNLLSHFFIYLAAAYEHTEIFLKVFPQMSFANESILLTSVGIRANVNEYFFKRFPFDMTLGISSNNFSISNYVKSTNFGLSAQVGETYGKLSLYGNVQYEITRGSVNYSINGDPNSANALLRVSRNVSKSFEGKNALLTSLGMSLKYSMFILCGEYTIAKNSVMTAGVLVTF